MKNRMVLIAVSIPIILLCILIARAEFHIRTGEQWIFEVTGYDPRDLLRGHYLQFRISYNQDENKNTCRSNQNCCLCLNKGDKITPKVHQTSCTIAKTQCDGYMLSKYKNTLNRFYIAESHAKKAEDILIKARAENNAYLKVSINKNGKPKIIDMLIGEQSITEAIK